MSQLEIILSTAFVAAMLAFAGLVVAIGWQGGRAGQRPRRGQADPATLWFPGG